LAGAREGEQRERAPTGSEISRSHAAILPRLGSNVRHGG
jgi:hypothetical protein